eukprot:TRINITY_DN34603_c0_g1_i1.p1 TRINITY_DN34603_c0_g1~~TRINITY_DN34603_c0_g1_i1.p1  ORF type:complete len:464 (+),score=83.82 TRINITY_DN34603_c0_g1_i1:45-1436(+)
MGRGLTRSRSKHRLTATEKRADKRHRSLSKLHSKIASDDPNWEDSDDEYSEEPYEIEDESIENEQVLEKYKLAAKFSQDALEYVVSQCVAGAVISRLCKEGDEKIAGFCDSVFRQPDEEGNPIFKGVAFPTSISPNDLTAHFAPHPAEGEANCDVALKNGDVIKIHMGAHIDGYMSQVAHTLVVGDDLAAAHPQTADVITAAYYAAEAALRVMRPDLQNRNEAVTNVFNKVAENYQVTTCQGVLSHRVLRWNPIGPSCIISQRISDKDDQVQEVEDITFGNHEVWHLDIAMSSEHEKLHCAPLPTTIYKRNDIAVAPKIKAAHYVLRSVRDKLLNYPFSMREFENLSQAKLGMRDLLMRDMIDPVPVMKTKKQDVTARFSWTILLTPKGVVRLTGLPLPVAAQSQKMITDSSVNQILSASLLPPTHPKRRKALKKKRLTHAVKRRQVADEESEGSGPEMMDAD